MFLPGADQIQSSMPDIYDAIITLDSATLDRTGLDRLDVPTLCVDHHKANDDHADVSVVDISCASTTQLLTRICEQESLALYKQSATCFLTGLYTDTGGFVHGNTDASVFQCAAHLSSCGADVATITQAIYHSQSFDQLQQISTLLSGASLYRQIGYVSIPSIQGKELKSQIVSRINSLKEVDIAVVFAQDGDDLRISYRTRSDDIDVSDLAGYL